MVDSILNSFGIDLLVVPLTFYDLFVLFIRIFISLGILVWCFGLIKSWIINIFGGRYLK